MAWTDRSERNLEYHRRKLGETRIELYRQPRPELAEAERSLIWKIEDREVEKIEHAICQRYDAARAERERMVEILRTQWPAALEAVQRILTALESSDREIAAVNKNLPSGCPPLVSAEAIARQLPASFVTKGRRVARWGELVRLP